MTESTRETLIVNARLVNEGATEDADVRIDRHGRIGAIGRSLEAGERTTVIDADGRILMPGMIDDQVHFREPGLTHKADIRSESRAAVAGGITSFMEMPNTSPPTVNAEALEGKYAIAARNSLANYAFYLGATNDNLDDIRTLDPKTACGIKIFMGESTGNMLVDDESVLEGIFAEAPVIIVTHCEDTPMINAATERYQREFGDDIPARLHPDIRPREACLKSSELAVDLARRHNADLHVLHLTTADEMKLFEPGPIAGKRITAEVCAHHLWFCRDDYEQLGHRIKCNPAIKDPSDRDALVEAVKEGRLDIIATDHAPHLLSEKDTTYMRAAAGLPLVQDALLTLIDRVADGQWSFEFIAEKTAHNVARRFQVHERGFVREGYWADLVLVDPTKTTPVRRENVLSKCGWSPFEGVEFRGRIDGVWVSGHLAHGPGATTAPPGLRLEFDR